MESLYWKLEFLFLGLVFSNFSSLNEQKWGEKLRNFSPFLKTGGRFPNFFFFFFWGW